MTDRTLKIPDTHIDFIRLIKRSPDTGEGWVKVSDNLRTFAYSMSQEQPRLYRVKTVDEQFMIKLSKEGEILEGYL